MSTLSSLKSELSLSKSSQRSLARENSSLQLRLSNLEAKLKLSKNKLLEANVKLEEEMKNKEEKLKQQLDCLWLEVAQNEEEKIRERTGNDTLVKSIKQILKRTVFKTNSLISKEELREINKTLTVEEIAEDGKNMDMILDFKNDNSFRYAEILTIKMLPNCNKFELNNISECNSDIINEIVDNGIPDKVGKFIFNNYPSNRVQCSLHFNSLCLALQHVMKSFCICNMQLTQNEFETILTVSSHCEEVGFDYCTIETDTKCDFSDIKSSNIKTLSLYNSGKMKNSNWTEKIWRYKNIVDGIYDCLPLSESIKRIERGYFEKEEHDFELVFGFRSGLKI